MPDNTLPVVVEFDHRHTVAVKNDGSTTRITATPNPKYAARYKRLNDLPFTGKPPTWEHWCWWYFPKAANHAESQARGEFFWEEFVRFARGARRDRAKDAQRLLCYAIQAMPAYPQGGVEANIFMSKVAEALIAHLRVGLDHGAAPQAEKTEAAA